MFKIDKYLRWIPVFGIIFDNPEDVKKVRVYEIYQIFIFTLLIFIIVSKLN